MGYRQPAADPDPRVLRPGTAQHRFFAGVAAGGAPFPGAPALPPAGFFVAGAHGGAGTSTLAALLRAETAAWQAARLPVSELPAFPDEDPAGIASRARLRDRLAGPVIVVARGNAEGARRAVTAVTALGYLRIRPAVLAVISDGAGPLPRAAGQRLDLLGDRAGIVIPVPFEAALRAAASPAGARLRRPLRRAVTEIAEAAASRLEGNSQ